MKQPSTLVAAIATFCCSTLLQAQTDAINGANTDGIVLSVTIVEGCTDPEACNYNVEADTDDGSCDFDVCVGCTYLLRATTMSSPRSRMGLVSTSGAPTPP